MKSYFTRSSFQLHAGHLLLDENYQPIKALTGPWEKRWVRAGSVTRFYCVFLPENKPWGPSESYLTGFGQRHR